MQDKINTTAQSININIWDKVTFQANGYFGIGAGLVMAAMCFAARYYGVL